MKACVNKKITSGAFPRCCASRAMLTKVSGLLLSWKKKVEKINIYSC